MKIIGQRISQTLSIALQNLLYTIETQDRVWKMSESCHSNDIYLNFVKLIYKKMEKYFYA